MIRLGSPSISAEDIDRVGSVLSSGFLVQGPQVQAFEADLAALLDVKHVVAMSNCTSALEVALRALGVGPGDLVVTSSYSWVATANVIEVVGATPVFIDISPTSYNLDVNALRQALGKLEQADDLGRVRAVMPVHAFGYGADMPAIQGIAGELGVPILEDAACGLGATMAGRALGTIGDLGCFSFHPRKSITTGEGGALVTSDDTVAAFARSYRNHGQSPTTAHKFEAIGHNYRLTDPMAALGRSQLLRLPAFLERRHQIMRTYLDLLRGHVELPEFDPERHTGQAFVVLLPEDVERDDLMNRMLMDGVETGTGTIAIPFAEAYRQKYGFKTDDFPQLASIVDRTLALPIHAAMSVADAEAVASALIHSLSRVTSRT